MSRISLARLVKPRTIERRLFLWLLIISLVPSLAVLAVASWASNEAARWVGVSGTWSGVAESGRALIDLTERDSAATPQLRAAARRHREQLSASLTQASRWEFVGERMRASLPWFFLGLALTVAGIALWAARRMARSVSRPIRELVQWGGLMAREQPLPPPVPREAGEVRELQALRRALRNASDEIASGRERALEAERTRSWGEMARRLAHEMKNPLTPLRLASHRLNSIAVERPELAEPITVIAEETHRLEELAGSFAMLGRPVEGPRAPIDVTDLLRRLLETDVPTSVAASVHAANAAFVLADYNALIQVFRNLVRNAIEAGATSIDVDFEEDGDNLHVRITDTGRGIADAAADRIFEPDFTSKPGGTGLGLAVARQLARAHGGDIAARGSAAGAVFTVTLPILDSEEDRA